jgi:large subunit ribosomal protein L13e
MVKHKNSIPKVHCRKHWQKYVKTDFDKSSKKKKRRTKRFSKLSDVKRYNFSPKNFLKPVVHNPTKMYNLKTRLGRGFSWEEINEIKISKKLALSVGISFDKRRRSNNIKKNSNVKRLNDFFEKIGLVSLKKTNENSKTEKSSIFNFLPMKIGKTNHFGNKTNGSTKLNFNDPSSLRIFKSLRNSKNKQEIS